MVLLIAFLIQGITAANITPERLISGAGNLGEFIGQAFPPDLSRLDVLAKALYETLKMAVVGVGLGVLLSLPVALVAAANTSPHPMLRVLARSLISVSRTIPDLVWAMVFLVAVGFGPLAGILAIAVDTVGFCGRFFAERIEEIKPGPSEALLSAGGTRTAAVAGAILPEVFPSFVATGLFSVEKAVRSAVVLGLVGAGGIGVELRASMNLFQYQQALTIILMILGVVIAIEQTSARIRSRLL
jgi:phosphonate transport system permease protein